MEIMLIAAIVALIVAVDRWIIWKIGTYACLLYIAEKNLPMPSDQELAKSRDKVITHAVEDFFGRKSSKRW